ncbi:hypothetical protein AAHC03_0305 [Spirometra sp. Aus1]
MSSVCFRAESCQSPSHAPEVIFHRMICMVLFGVIFLRSVHCYCEFPQFLYSGTTNTWWSGMPSLRRSSREGTQFSQLTASADLNKLSIIYPGFVNSQPYLENEVNRVPSGYAHMYVRNRSEAINLNYRCKRTVDERRFLYLAEMFSNGLMSKSVCLHFKPLDLQSPTEVFELLQGEVETQKTSVKSCHLQRAEHFLGIWIPSVAKYPKPKPTICPFVGGFQAKSFRNILTKEKICSSSVYATIDSECIKGEGIEFHFNEASCNPFEPKLVTQLNCYVRWTEAKNTFVVLTKQINKAGFIMATMVYQEQPLPADTENNSYRNFTSVFLGMGIFRPQPLSAMIPTSESFLSDLGFPRRDNQVTTTTYEIQLRGAFGVCDDEEELCEKGCNADARNRLFCHRSCPTVTKECSSVLQGSCEISSSYRGSWRLLEMPTSNLRGFSLQNNQFNVYSKKDFKIMTIGEKTVNFRNILAENSVYEFSCLREASEILPDWFILGGKSLQPGCHPRAVCLEVYQSRPVFTNDGPNTNTLQYRISKSQRQGVDIYTLCNFSHDQLSAEGSSRPRSTKLLVKHPFRNDRPRWTENESQSKCELYQIRLRGSIRINARRLQTYLEAWRTARSSSTGVSGFIPSPSTHESRRDSRNAPGWNESRASLPNSPRLDNRYARARDRSSSPDLKPQWINCPSQLSDFNRNLGTTGEFDGYLRITSTCQQKQFFGFLNTAHRCVSVYNIDREFRYVSRFLMLITYSDLVESFFCWIVRESGEDRSKSFHMYIFLSPQCDYEETSSGEILVNNQSAFAVVHAMADKGPCLNCVQSTAPNPSLQSRSEFFKQMVKEFVNPPASGDPSAATSGSVQRQNTRHLRTALLLLHMHIYVNLDVITRR